MKETLTKENFWDEMEQKYPKAMAHFKEWIDQYKKDNHWGYIFNPEFTTKHISGLGSTEQHHSWPPKYHELPIAIQYGIFLHFVADFGKKEALIVGNTELTQPDFYIGVKDSIIHFLYLMEEFYERNNI